MCQKIFSSPSEHNSGHIKSAFMASILRGADAPSELFPNAFAPSGPGKLAPVYCLVCRYYKLFICLIYLVDCEELKLSDKMPLSLST